MGKKGKQAGDTSTTSKEAVSLETLTPGDGQTFPAPGDDVTVHYVGALISDGSVFDSSRKKQIPFVFKLGAGAVIKGWDLGVAQMSLGQRAKLTIAAHAAYGKAGCIDKVNASGTGVIPPNADLSFDVELLDINHRASVSVLAKYQQTLDAWIATKMKKFDADADVREAMEAKHGGRDGYIAHLESVTAAKYEAERARRVKAVPPALTPSHPPAAAEAAGETGLEAATAAAQLGECAAPNGKEAPAQLHFGPKFAAFKVEPNSKSEGSSPNFPRNLHNAAELLCAAASHALALSPARCTSLLPMCFLPLGGLPVAA
jgi:FK506-binding protein 1